ncbi:hypothetical protein OPT61_g977 [Boeremia exigua]|uniref:Uncharacterized protein n=1 Tax=Boeremia exigua TaxID=749465 RepID=A0ACC2IRX2_9PLEO|nr:hypothetical protein OPT61_g977 [Boeremia exigua]
MFDVTFVSSKEILGGNRTKLFNAAPAGVAADAANILRAIAVADSDVNVPQVCRSYGEITGRSWPTGIVTSERETELQDKYEDTVIPLGLDAVNVFLTDDSLRSFASIVGGDLHASIPRMAAHALEKWTGCAKLLVHWMRESDKSIVGINGSPSLVICVCQWVRTPKAIHRAGIAVMGGAVRHDGEASAPHGFRAPSHPTADGGKEKCSRLKRSSCGEQEAENP